MALYNTYRFACAKSATQTSSQCVYIWLLYREVWCADVFGLPRDMMLGVATLLLGAAAVDRQDKKVCSGTSE